MIADKYRVERVLGTGGMGYVVAARHLQLDQLVAMKFLHTDAVGNAEATTRFLREAQAVAKLRSEHIAKTYDIGALEGGEPYIVMEYLDGKDLSALVKERPVLRVEEACIYVLQACVALAEAHSFGIIHRDIKLANLFVARSTTGAPLVKVLDFGVSKSSLVTSPGHEVTHAASLLGSPRFMSPEQMRDPRGVDARTDVWSLGVVLYRLLSGRPPFDADSLARLIAMVMHEREPPLSRLVNDLPRGLEIAVARCLEKDKAKRFADVAALAWALVPFCAEGARAHVLASRVSAVLDRSPKQHDQASSDRPSVAPARDSAAPWASAAPSSRRRRDANALILAGGLAAVFAGAGLVVQAGRTATYGAGDTVVATPIASAALSVVAPPQTSTATPAPARSVQEAAVYPRSGRVPPAPTARPKPSIRAAVERR